MPNPRSQILFPLFGLLAYQDERPDSGDAGPALAGFFYAQ
jgi:hypothetical protein